MKDDSGVIDLVTRARNRDKQAWDQLVERYAPLIWSICRRHELDGANAGVVGQNVWLQLVNHLETLQDPAALAGWLATTTRRECSRVLHAKQGSHAAGYTPEVESIPDERVETTDQELLGAEHHAALRQAFGDLPAFSQQLIILLAQDPPVPHAEISARLGIPIGSIGPSRSRSLDKLRRHPAVAALTKRRMPTLLDTRYRRPARRLRNSSVRGWRRTRPRFRRARLGGLVTWGTDPTARAQGCTLGAGMRSDAYAPGRGGIGEVDRDLGVLSPPGSNA
jgi:RNA polymerase sigma factor (sigma-70 family)